MIIMTQCGLRTWGLLTFCGLSLAVCTGCGTQIGIAASPSDLFVEVNGSRVVNVVAVMDVGAPRPITEPVTITSNDESVAEVIDGSVVGVSEGETTLAITDGTFAATAKVTVVPEGTLPTRLVVTPTSIICTPESPDTQLDVFAVLTSGTSTDITAEATYGSNASTVALVTPEGRVVCVDPGNAQIAVQYLGLAILINVAVEAVPPASVAIVPDMLQCVVGERPTVQVLAENSEGVVTDVTDSAVYSSTAPGVALVSNGVVDCRVVGTAVIRANVNGAVAELEVEVVTEVVPPNQLVEIRAEPASVVCGVTQRAPFTVIGETAGGATFDVSNDPQLVFTTISGNAVLILDNQPICTQRGQATVGVTLGALETTVAVTVQ
jgi:hypothetical protein